jgi:putative transposase
MPYYRLFYHIVWSTKNRLPLITQENCTPIYASIKAKVKELGGITHALNGSNNHIHLVVTLPPKIALANFIGQVKGCSSHLASRWNGRYEPFAWQRE